MSKADQHRWNERYQAGEYAERPYPSRFLERWLPEAEQRSPGSLAVDIACGLGRNTRFLAQCGYRARGVDISDMAISQAKVLAAKENLSIDWHILDLESDPLPPGPYDLIVVCRFLDRLLLPTLKSALVPQGGRIVYEQHVVTDLEVGGPRNPRFRLQPNELLHSFSDLQILHYNEGLITDPDGGLMALAQLVAERR